MIIYNVTSKVAWPIHDAWVAWMQQEHIPEVMATGLFDRYQMVRLLETEEDDGPTYAVQYYVPSQALYEQYISLHAPALRQKAFEKWGEQFISFRTIMELVG